jgi:hypothetical protein
LCCYPSSGGCAQQEVRCSKWYGFEQRQSAFMMIYLRATTMFPTRCRHHSKNKMTARRELKCYLFFWCYRFM